MRLIRPRLHLFLLGLPAVLAGCSVPIERFAPADRIDVSFNKVWNSYDPPFGEHLDHLREKPAVVCNNSHAVSRVYDVIKQYPHGWVEYWGIPPSTPPLTLTFHQQKRWLGTLDVYPDALGHAGNRVHTIKKRDACAILEALCDCVDNPQ